VRVPDVGANRLTWTSELTFGVVTRESVEMPVHYPMYIERNVGIL